MENISFSSPNIRCTMDLCEAYDDGPSHVSWRLCAYIPSFGLFIRQRPAKLLQGLLVLVLVLCRLLRVILLVID